MAGGRGLYASHMRNERKMRAQTVWPRRAARACSTVVTRSVVANHPVLDGCVHADLVARRLFLRLNSSARTLVRVAL